MLSWMMSGIYLKIHFGGKTKKPMNIKKEALKVQERNKSEEKLKFKALL